MRQPGWWSFWHSGATLSTTEIHERLTDPDPAGDAVIGCVCLYPPEPDSAEQGRDVPVQTWVCASHGDLDGPLADAFAGWIAADWPWQNPDRQPHRHRHRHRHRYRYRMRVAARPHSAMTERFPTQLTTKGPALITEVSPSSTGDTA